MFITKDLKYIGVNDREIDLFEGQYSVPNGMAYNSYIISDEKIAVFDSVDARFCDEWLKNVAATLGDKSPDYLIISHMEPDHSANILAFAQKYPTATLVASKHAFVMLNQFFGTDFPDRRIIVKDGDTLSLGKHNLSFIAAPLVHWPEVMTCYDSYDKVFFSADAFGKFGALDTDEDWDCEARRYYFGIVGKFGVQVQNLLKRVKPLEIKTICPLHGPIIVKNIEHCIELYDIWSSYGVESEGVVIAYTSVYGHTKAAALMLKAELKSLGCSKVTTFDLARDDMAEAVEDAFRYGKLVLATTTYNGDIFPFMREFITHLTEHNYQNRTIAFIENGSWAPFATKVMKGMFENSKNITFTENSVRILSALNDQSKAQIKALAKELMAKS